MKDELGGKIMPEFVALRSKLYVYRQLDNKEDKKCKGIKKCVVKETISFNDYEDCIFDSESKSIYRYNQCSEIASMKSIESKLIRLP